MAYKINFLKVIYPNKIEDIKFLEADKNYTILRFNNGDKIRILYHLLQFQQLLSNYNQFIRIHRSYIVNKTFIINIDYKATFLKLITKDALPIDKKFISELEKWQKKNNF